MANEPEFPANPDISEEYSTFEEFCAENAGREMTYLEMVGQNPLAMDSVTLAFSMRRVVRLSRGLMDLLLKSLNNELPPTLQDILATKGIQLDKGNAAVLRNTIFSFRDCEDPDTSMTMIRALQLLTIARERSKVILQLAESYRPPEEGWNLEDFGGDESMYETVRSVEDPTWLQTEES